MNGGKPDKRRRQRNLTEEEQALWQQISQKIKPLQPARDASPHTPPPSQKKAVSAQTQQQSKQQRKLRLGGAKPAQIAALQTPTKQAVNEAQFACFDQKLAKKVGKGRTKIDARLDLHGMRQHEAKAELRRFLFSSLAKGHRIILVITGKGEPLISDVPWDGGEAENRGVLKRMVPHWLREPEFSAVVVSYMSAHIHHGGEGALYIHLKKPGRM
ncbi:MAG: Smr/MutS family protein [Pseudomonadota bacterium]